ncbi:MAG TPA: hypothetical protein VNO35_06070 [Steroidobacteraceae bacterium]|nr:hypothetical protein [Steroidobacteraceae bacterium]
MKIKLHFVGAVLCVFALACVGLTARAQDAHEDSSPCTGSAPEPGQSSAWSVAFCNRTGHDLVLEFHDNDCPAKDWSRRGDVYQRTLRRGESKSLPLCYANEPPTKKPAPGTPTLRIPGGKGVTTTWNVVGDCGDRSKPLNLDARTFYDRGEYKTGIILLQYPSGASHCASDASASPGASSAAAVGSLSGASAAPSSGGSSASAAGPYAPSSAAAASASGGAPSASAAPSSAAGTAAAGGPQPPVATHSPIVTPPAAPAVPRGNGAPTLSAVIDTTGLVQHIVLVYAKGGAGYKCNFNLALTFTDGGGWNDRAKVDITGNDEQVPIATRKYLKSVSAVKITSNSCAPM